MLDGIKRIHFIGVGGVGMSALAYVLIKRGFMVSGSDLAQGYMSNVLAHEGAVIFVGHAACQVEGAEVVVVSTAISHNNPEYVEARRRRIPVIHRSDVLAYIINNHKGVAVAGAHGKTTISSMLSCICYEGKLDPTVVVGGIIPSLGGNALNGHSDIVVAEADESDGSFLKFHPFISVISNIENDHLDYYGSEERILEAFGFFVENLQPGGKAVLCYDNEKVRALSKKTKQQVISYAVDYNEADYTAQNIVSGRKGTDFDVYYQGVFLCKGHLIIPGRHNVQNALGALAVARELGVELTVISHCLERFTGAKRRFETKGKVREVWVVDDYAHHPTEIKATLKAAKQTETGRLVCVFQPHRYTRTKLLMKEFCHAFVDCDELIMTEIYAASEPPIPGISGALLAHEVEKTTGQKVVFLPTLEKVESYLLEHVKKNDLIMTVGAGDIYKVGEKLVKDLARG